jgi:hypothetical protein
VLLDVADHELNFEVVGIRLCDLVQPKENWLETRQARYLIDLLVQTFQLIQRIQVLSAHDVIVH